MLTLRYSLHEAAPWYSPLGGCWVGCIGGHTAYEIAITDLSNTLYLMHCASAAVHSTLET